jgi:hypothetical protein
MLLLHTHWPRKRTAANSISISSGYKAYLNSVPENHVCMWRCRSRKRLSRAEALRKQGKTTDVSTMVLSVQKGRGLNSATVVSSKHCFQGISALHIYERLYYSEGTSVRSQQMNLQKQYHCSHERASNRSKGTREPCNCKLRK